MKLLLPESKQEQHLGMQQILLQIPREQDNMQNPMEAHIKEILPRENHLQVKF